MCPINFVLALYNPVYKHRSLFHPPVVSLPPAASRVPRGLLTTQRSRLEAEVLLPSLLLNFRAASHKLKDEDEESLIFFGFLHDISNSNCGLYTVSTGF